MTVVTAGDTFPDYRRMGGFSIRSITEKLSPAVTRCGDPGNAPEYRQARKMYAPE